MKSKSLANFRFSLFFSKKFSFTVDSDNKKNLKDSNFKPGESVFDLSVAQKYIMTNIKSSTFEIIKKSFSF
jgi:hypothetical protein